MKTIFKVIAVVLFIGAFTACVQDDDYSVPAQVTIVEPTIAEHGHEYSFATLIAMYTTNFNTIVDLDTQVPNPIVDINNPALNEYSYIVGYVISNDRTGNFYKSIYIQDAVENPTAGITISVDMYDTYIKYGEGRKVYIKLNGLGFDQDHGVYTLGVLDGTSIERIPELDVPTHILRSAEVNTMVPMMTTATDINAGGVPDGVLVQLPNMQLPMSNLGVSFANLNDTWSVNRNLMSCDDNAQIIIRNSGYADFRTVTMPEGKGTLTAVLSQYNSTKQLYIREPADLDFTELRCDPDYLDCTTPSGGGASIFMEDFQSFTTYAAEGWTNVNVSSTSTDWFISGYSGNDYSRISAYNSNDTEADVWLVTPSINLDSTTAEELSFDIQANYDNATNLTVFVSTDFTGDPTTATWQQLDAAIPVGPASAFGTFTTVGPLNISCLDGDVNIGFFYEGSDPSATTRYHLDNVEVTGI